jgi:uncharacterized HAD superfamily protein
MPEEKPIVIVDMDGTLADVGHRLHYIRGKGKPNWKKFFSEQRHDLPIKAILKQVCELAGDHEIVIVTGRPKQYFHETQQWLRKYKVPYSRLYMRPKGDHRPDFLVKKDILKKDIGAQRVVMVLEDRPRVCEMYRQAGLKVIEVPSDQWSQEVNEVYRERS